MIFRIVTLVVLATIAVTGPTQAQNATTGLRAMEAENDALGFAV